jgi:hypothetical protein
MNICGKNRQLLVAANRYTGEVSHYNQNLDYRFLPSRL